MEKAYSIKSFDELCEKYSTWIIKFQSHFFKKPLFLVWYTDTDKNSTDRLLTLKNGSIFATTSLVGLKEIIHREKNDLSTFDNLGFWLANFNDLAPIENVAYNIDFIKNSISKRMLNIPALEHFTGFINLYGDFMYQDESNRYLEVYFRNKLIKKTWNYYYDYIFWPRFNSKEKFKTWKRPYLQINSKALLAKFENIANTFEERIYLK